MKNSSNKILSVAVVLLLIANIGLVIFLMNGKGRNDGKRIGGGKGDPSEMMAKELGMTEQQIKEHKQLKETEPSKYQRRNSMFRKYLNN